MSLSDWHRKDSALGGKAKIKTFSGGHRNSTKHYTEDQLQHFKALVLEGYNITHACKMSGVRAGKAYGILKTCPEIFNAHEHNKLIGFKKL